MLSSEPKAKLIWHVLSNMFRKPSLPAVEMVYAVSMPIPVL
jgi:hypothetical protein